MILSRIKEIEKCPNVTCSAPMCLFDPMVERCCWYPDDEVCKKNFPPDWVKNQKKIRAKTRNVNTYYTFKMLNRNCIIGKGIVGVDPDRPEESQEKSWLKRHPVKRTLTEEEKETLRERFKEKCLSI